MPVSKLRRFNPAAAPVGEQAAGGKEMGIVIDFPVEQRVLARSQVSDAEAGTVIILPVVRVERGPDLPTDGVEGSGAGGSSKRRRRRA